MRSASSFIYPNRSSVKYTGYLLRARGHVSVLPLGVCGREAELSLDRCQGNQGQHFETRMRWSQMMPELLSLYLPSSGWSWLVSMPGAHVPQSSLEVSFFSTSPRPAHFFKA